METITVLGIDVLAAESQADLIAYLQHKTGMLVAINAEKVILCDEDPILKNLITQAEFKYADGISIVKTLQQKEPQYKLERIAGADLWLALLQARKGEPVFLVGADSDTLAKTSKKLTACGINIVGTQDGYFTQEEEPVISERIKQSGATFVSVAMGSPKQEIFIQNLKLQHPNCLYMGVGGSYDVFIGKVKRAPQSWQKLGLEWLYRLLKQPTRWRRQLRLIKYAYYFITKRL